MTLKHPSAQSYSWRAEATAMGALTIGLVGFLLAAWWVMQ